jgi:diguanylate cyclase (GGDEF)-like protein
MHSSSSDQNFLTYTQFQNLLRIEFARSRRYGFPLSVLAMQVDRLEHLRDLYGMQARRLIVDQVVASVRAQCRLSDSMGLVGDRVVLILPHTDQPGAEVVGERLSRQVAGLAFEVQGREIALTVSVGIASCEPGAIFYDAVLKNAEKVLAEVAAAGGNQVRVHQTTAPERE